MQIENKNKQINRLKMEGLTPEKEIQILFQGLTFKIPRQHVDEIIDARVGLSYFEPTNTSDPAYDVTRVMVQCLKCE